MESVRRERSGWRDEELSQRHREWGWNCPAVDIDFLMLEYNFGLPVALVEYKRYDTIPARRPDHPTYRAMAALCNRDPAIPFLIAHYSNTEWWFRVIPMNAAAERLYTFGQEMSEFEYVSSLYAMRKHVMDRQLSGKLKTARPPKRTIVVPNLEF